MTETPGQSPCGLTVRAPGLVSGADNIARRPFFRNSTLQTRARGPTYSTKVDLAKSAAKNPELWVKAAGAGHDDGPKGGSKNPWSPSYRGGDAEAERIRVIKNLGTKAAQSMAASCQVDLAGRALRR